MLKTFAIISTLLALILYQLSSPVPFNSPAKSNWKLHLQALIDGLQSKYKITKANYFESNFLLELREDWNAFDGDEFFQQS